MNTITTTLVSRARRVTGSAVPRWLGALLSVALAVTVIQATGAAPALAAAAGRTGPPSGPVSNAFAMGGGIGGSIDQRTGAFQASVPLLAVTGPAGTGLSLTLGYDQSLAALGAASAAGNRFGLGAGWTLGVPWVDTAGGVHVYPASGGSYAYDASQPTGLAGYPLRDLSFAKGAGTTQPPPGVPARPYLYSLTTLDGTTDRFDANGNLIEQADRFGNAIDLTWQQSGSQWKPASVTDSYGEVTKFAYTAGTITVTSPPNAEGITAATTLHLDSGRLTGVSDPLGQTTSFGYTPVSGLPAPLLSSVISPTGEHTAVAYTSPNYEPDVAVVSTVDVTDPRGNPVLPELRFNINPAGDSQHNYTGYPLYNKNGANGLFNSGDSGYRYTTELTNGTSTVDATYNSLHLLVSQKVYQARGVLSQAQSWTYPPVNSVNNLPANYANPTSATVAYGDPQIGPTRTVTTSAAYNNQGLQTSATDAAGTTTTTSYSSSYGLPLTQTVTGKDGATSVTTDTLSGDGKTVKTVTTAVGSTDAQGKVTAQARTVTTYSYNGLGQVTGKLLAWAPGAKPPGNSGGPDQTDQTQTISTDTAAHTQTDVTTAAAGTPDAASTTTVTDLVTGQVLSQTAPGNLTTSYTYDALGRELTATAPGGQTTKTVYNSPTLTTVTAPSGLETQTTTDVTGRTVKVTDNISGEKLTANPAARTVETDHYSTDGTQAATTTPAGTATTTFDPLGRPVQIVEPDGITQADTYNDVANTQKVSLLPAGAPATAPVSVTTDNFNNLNQPVSSATSYADGTPQAPAAEAYDGLGRVTSYTAGDVTAAPHYTGAGGLLDGTTLTPGDPAGFPGHPAQAATGNTLTGALTGKTLTEQAAAGQANTKAAEPAAGTTYTYDAAGRVHTATTADGAVTSYTYTPAGQVATITQPSGTVTSYTYDAKTGRLAETDVQAPGGTTQKTAYTYDPATGRVTSVYDPAHPADAISYDYDADGHVTAIHYPDGTTTTASYDDNGQLATTTDITGAVTTYTYNTGSTCGPAATDLCQAVQARDGTTLARVAYTYDTLDRVHTITRGNGDTTTIGYTDASQVKTQTTAAADGTVLRTDGYTYDSHGNVATHTITGALPAPAQAGPGHGQGQGHGHGKHASPPTTTAYGYDAYNRLISSAVYPGTTPTGTPATTTTYTLDAAGNVTGQDTTTAAGTTHTVNTITPGGELTGRTTGGTATSQKFDADGNVTTDLAGDTYTYQPDGQQASVTTPAGATTSYAYWPDHTRRTATTTVGGVAHVITFHYATTGGITNDTYTGGGPDTITASYLSGVNREARTLDTATGHGPGTVQDTGPGTGYYLTDAHGSVTAMIDDNGQVTASYAYGDYGQPQGTGPAPLPTPAADPAGNAAVNPFTYDGAYTNPSTGTQYLPARTYDPAQGRFLSADAADQFNRYQAFAANPIINTDPTGQLAVPQWAVDAGTAALLIFLGAAALFTGFAGAIAIAEVGIAEATASAVASTALNLVSGATNLAAGACSVFTAANKKQVEDGGTGFLSLRDEENLTTASFALGIIGGVTGAAAGLTDFLGKGAETAATAADPAATAAAEVPRQEGPSITSLAANIGPAEDLTPATAIVRNAGPDVAEASAASTGGRLPAEGQQGITALRGQFEEPVELPWEEVPVEPSANVANPGQPSANIANPGQPSANVAEPGQPFATVNNAPANVATTNPDILLVTTDPVPPTIVNNPNPNPVTQNIADSVAGNLVANTGLGDPVPTASGLNVPGTTLPK